MTVPALAGLVMAGCVTPAQFLDSKQGMAVHTAVVRAQFEMSCPTATGRSSRARALSEVPGGPGHVLSLARSDSMRRSRLLRPLSAATQGLLPFSGGESVDDAETALTTLAVPTPIDRREGMVDKSATAPTCRILIPSSISTRASSSRSSAVSKSTDLKAPR
jgi:hypothetical protein